jgi:hypothetical protein
VGQVPLKTNDLIIMSQTLSVSELGQIVSFETPFSDLEEAKDYLHEKLEDTSFVRNCPSRTFKFISDLLGARNPSEKQTAWIHYLAYKDMKKQEEKETPEEEIQPEFLPLVQQMYSKVKSPGRKFTLRLPMVTVATVTKGANKGYLYVFTEGNHYLGKICDRGILFTNQEVSEDVRNILLEANDNLFELAKIYGHETGMCSVCGRELRDPLSIQMGIGPVCSKRFE